MILFFLFVFFKQKTAYELRISDWSSDVCSSDLRFLLRHGREILSPTDLHLIREGLSGGTRPVSDIADRLSGPRRLSRVYAAVLRGHALLDHRAPVKLGSASCRERVCQSV